MILSTFLLALLQMNYSKHLGTINQPIENMLQTTTFLDVQFIIRSPSAANSEIIDDMYKTVSRVLPTSCISLNESVPAVLPSFLASQGTLIFYAWISKGPPNVQQTEDMIDVIVHDDNRPKVLLTTIIEEENSNFENVFKQMWNRKLIDVTILEISKSDRHEFVIKVHQYNPFTNVYERQPYTSSVQWFPNKLTNLHGYPLKVYVVNRTGHLQVTKNAKGHPVTYKGPSAKALKVLARFINFSVVPLSNNSPFTSFTQNASIDVVIPMFPYFPEYVQHLNEKTLPLTVETWCAVIPIEYKYQNINLRAVTGMAVNFIIVFLFWLLSILLKFNRNMWMPIKIFALIVSTSTSIRPSRTIEKIIFLTVILVSALYTTNLYADLTTTSLKGNTEVDYENFKELDESGLTPNVLKPLFDVTFANDDESFRALKKKAVTMNVTLDCIRYLAKYKNITCFMESKAAETIIYRQRRRGKKVIKVSRNLCYAKPPVGYFLGKHSPYKDRFVEILIRMEQTGIPSKWYRNEIRKITPRQKYYIEVTSGSQSLFMWNLIYIAGCGWLISLVFVSFSPPFHFLPLPPLGEFYSRCKATQQVVSVRSVSDRPATCVGGGANVFTLTVYFELVRVLRDETGELVTIEWNSARFENEKRHGECEDLRYSGETKCRTVNCHRKEAIPSAVYFSRDCNYKSAREKYRKKGHGSHRVEQY